MKQIFYLFLTIIMIMVAATSIAKTTEDKVVKKENSVADIKQNFEKEKDPLKAFYLLSDLVKQYASVPITSEIIADAKKSAESLLTMSSNFKKNWNYGNAIHHSHLVLGRLNLLEKKAEEAKKQLKLAGQTPGSPQLDSFGPNMTLAKELLEKGEKKAVLEYFDDCLKFWDSKFGKPEIEEWKRDIEKGKIPSFKGNLVY